MVDMQCQQSVSKAPVTRQRTTEPAWIVTAPHEVPRSLGRERAPWGDYHLRPDGAALTACGLSTLTWTSFWTLKPSPQDQNACVACRSIASRLRRL